MLIPRKLGTALATCALAAVAVPAAAQAAASATPPQTSGGVGVLGSAVSAPGEPAPFALLGLRTPPGAHVAAGDPVPPGIVVVSARVSVPAGTPAAGEKRSITLSCPTAMKFAGYTQPAQYVPPKAVTSIGPRDAIPGYSASARIRIDPGAEPVAFEVNVGILCRTPDASGSIAEHPRKLRRGERRGRICVDAEKLSRMPGYGFEGYVHRGQPVAIQRRSKSGAWTRIVSDYGQKGWIRTSALCR
jgi:hypothetical protein